MLERRALPLAGRQGQAVGELIRVELGRLLKAARDKRLNVRAVGVSVPGISDSKTGRIWAPNIPGWEDYPLRRELVTAIGKARLRVAIDSDRACYILGETWKGAAKGCRNAIFLAVGTGIGAGVLIDGRILRGAHDIAGAIGWLALERPFRPEYVPCGCFEYHASGEGLAKVARRLAGRKARGANRRGLGHYKEWTARGVLAAYERGDPLGQQVITEAVQFWGMAVANLVSLFNPEKIIFGGGVFGPAAALLGDIYAEARRWAQPVAINQVKLHASRLGGNAGLYGAAQLALQGGE